MLPRSDRATDCSSQLVARQQRSKGGNDTSVTRRPWKPLICPQLMGSDNLTATTTTEQRAREERLGRRPGQALLRYRHDRRGPATKKEQRNPFLHGAVVRQLAGERRQGVHGKRAENSLGCGFVEGGL